MWSLGCFSNYSWTCAMHAKCHALNSIRTSGCYPCLGWRGQRPLHQEYDNSFFHFPALIFLQSLDFSLINSFPSILHDHQQTLFQEPWCAGGSLTAGGPFRMVQPGLVPGVSHGWSVCSWKEGLEEWTYLQKPGEETAFINANQDV